MSIIVRLGVSVAPFVISYFAFREGEAGLGLVFLIVGIALAVFQIFLLTHKG